MNKKLLSTMLTLLLLGMIICIIFECIYYCQHPPEVIKCESTIVKQTENNKILRRYYKKEIYMQDEIVKLKTKLTGLEEGLSLVNYDNDPEEYEYLLGKCDGFREALEILAEE